VNLTTTVGLAVSVPVACWLATCTRLVPRGRWVAVVRRAAVRRVHDAGAAYRMPFVDSFVSLPSGPHGRPLTVRATTCDGLRVAVLAEATVVLPRPVTGIRFVDPWPAAEPDAEDAIARAVASWTTTEVLSGVGAYHRSLRHAVSAAVDPHGVTVHELELGHVDVIVDVQDDEGSLERGRR
jgi:hypothetical protein